MKTIKEIKELSKLKINNESLLYDDIVLTWKIKNDVIESHINWESIFFHSKLEWVKEYENIKYTVLSINITNLKNETINILQNNPIIFAWRRYYNFNLYWTEDIIVFLQQEFHFRVFLPTILQQSLLFQSKEIEKIIKLLSTVSNLKMSLYQFKKIYRIALILVNFIDEKLYNKKKYLNILATWVKEYSNTYEYIDDILDTNKMMLLSAKWEVEEFNNYIKISTISILEKTINEIIFLNI